jgi:protein-tyrosine phosphatase
VLAAAKEHRSAGARLHVPALSRILTLNDLADLLRGVTPGDVASLGGSGTWVRQVVAAAMARREVVPARQDGVDITDPIGGPPPLFEQMAREVEAALPAIATVLRGPAMTRETGAG